ncbi:MAG: (d)CMP kinase [Candidatus Bathyarchaeales archaeon]
MAVTRKSGKTTKEPVVICISGMAGSGKSTVAKKLAERYGLKYYSGGEALKELAAEKGHKPFKHGWWESEEGICFIKERENDPKFDEVVDKKLMELAQKGNVILDSWTMPWLLKKGFKIWLEASLQKRAERIAKRDKITFQEALEAIKRKEEGTKAIYKKLYGFDLGTDFSPFHLILDTDNLATEEVFQVLCKVLDNIIFKSETN